MTRDDLTYVADLVKARSGIVLTPEKAYLIESRLTPLARTRGHKDLDALIVALRGNEPGLVEAVVEAMTTNESLFFRDQRPFEQFRRLVLPKLLQARGTSRTIRIWSAACSSGQEPYSLAMLLSEEAPKLAGWTVEILGTDLSKAMVERARAGSYSQFEVQRGMPPAMLARHFTRNGDKWNASAALKSMLRFRTFNLLDDPSALGTFDVVLCRNVLIYFDQATKGRILDRISGRLTAEGTLYLGGSETVFGITERFEPIPGERGIYQLARAAQPIKAAA
jgi:chemotaxis protein methyltransferase CheR